MSTPTTHTFDAGALRRAFAERDVTALADLYTEDAVSERVDAQHPPGDPQILRGRDALVAEAASVLARDMTHEISDVAIGPDAVGYLLRCRYPDGSRVTCAAIGQLRDGRIAREVCVQAWDG
jgi:ketosteroid isomerase-like protein